MIIGGAHRRRRLRHHARSISRVIAYQRAAVSRIGVKNDIRNMTVSKVASK